MDSGEIYAKITQIREAATTIGRSTSTISDCLESVDAEVRALGTDRFMGIGAEAFRSEYYRLTPKMRETFEALAKFQDKLNAAADDIEVAARSAQM